MGCIPSVDIAFEGSAPDLRTIADELAERSGLAVSVEDSEAAIKGGLFGLHGRLWFTDAARQQVKLYSYRPGSVRELHDQMFGEFGASLPFARCVRGLNEPSEIQVVYLTPQGLLDPTLPTAILLALEAMGGELRVPIAPEERGRCAGTIGIREVRRRHRTERLKGWLVVAMLLLLLPVLVPIYLVNIGIFALTLPSRLRRTRRLALELMRKHQQEHDDPG